MVLSVVSECVSVCLVMRVCWRWRRESSNFFSSLLTGDRQTDRDTQKKILGEPN